MVLPLSHPFSLFLIFLILFRYFSYFPILFHSFSLFLILSHRRHQVHSVCRGTSPGAQGARAGWQVWNSVIQCDWFSVK